MKKKNKILKILLLLIFIILIVSLVASFIMNNTHFTSNIDDPNAVTNDFELNGFHKSNNMPATFDATSVETNGEYVNLSFKVKDVHLSEDLFDYKDDIRLRITYSQDSKKIYNCEVINRFSGEIIKNLSKNNLKKLFDVSYNKKVIKVIKKDFSTKIKLSELDENELYEFEKSNNPDDTYKVIEIINDIGKNCIIYYKNSHEFDRIFNLSKNINSRGYIKSFDFMYDTSFDILYKVVDDNELSKIISQNEIIYLSNYGNGDLLDTSGLHKYIYNDTQKNAFINADKVKFEGFEDSSSNMLKRGEICELNNSDSTYVTFENTNNTDNIVKKNEST